MLGEIEVARLIGFCTLKFHSMAVRMIDQPVDPLSNGHVANDRSLVVCLGRSLSCYHRASTNRSDVVVSDISEVLAPNNTFRLMLPYKPNLLMRRQ